MAADRDERSSIEHQIWELREEYSQYKSDANIGEAAKVMERLTALYGTLEGYEVAQSVAYELLARDYMELNDLPEARRAAMQALDVDKRYIGMDLPYYPLHQVLLAEITDRDGKGGKAGQLRHEALKRMLGILRGERMDGTRKRTYRFYDPQLDREHMVRMCQTAVELATRMFGEGSIEHIETMIQVARFYEEEYNPQLAISFYLEAISATERAKRVYTPEFIMLLEAAADIYMMNDEDREAEDLYKREIAVAKTMYGEESAEVSKSMGNLATVYLKKGENRKAEETVLASLELDKGRGDEGSPDQIRRQKFLATAYHNRKEFAKAIKYYEIVRDALRSMGEDDSALAVVLNQLGQVHRQVGRPDRAIKEYQECLRVVERFYGPESIYYAGVLQNMAETYKAIGDETNARQTLERVNALCQKYGYGRNPWA
ncbi:MAG: Tetratricopeptide repeat protein [Methanomassiliicoccales archaeon PtaU1.Bin124]|nr:MAG: Tetratricopeptide repeat protein [Methanomassiliicoccales archaeon PtaU1.Bin124]